MQGPMARRVHAEPQSHRTSDRSIQPIKKCESPILTHGRDTPITAGWMELRPSSKHTSIESSGLASECRSVLYHNATQRTHGATTCANRKGVSPFSLAGQAYPIRNRIGVTPFLAGRQRKRPLLHARFHQGRGGAGRLSDERGDGVIARLNAHYGEWHPAPPRQGRAPLMARPAPPRHSDPIRSRSHPTGRAMTRFRAGLQSTTACACNKSRSTLGRILCGFSRGSQADPPSLQRGLALAWRCSGRQRRQRSGQIRLAGAHSVHTGLLPTPETCGRAGALVGTVQPLSTWTRFRDVVQVRPAPPRPATVISLAAVSHYPFRGRPPSPARPPRRHSDSATTLDRMSRILSSHRDSDKTT